MSWVLIRNEDGHYVSDPHRNGTGSSYTKLLQRARRYTTREAALADACGNEHAALFDGEH